MLDMSPGSMGLAQGIADRLMGHVRVAKPADEAELLDFRARMYGPKSVYSEPSWVHWLYQEGPGALARGPALWLYWDRGHIEAQQGAILAKVKVGSSERNLAWAVDLMVSPSHRLRGVGAVLPQAVVHAADVVAGTEVSSAAQKAFLRAGWAHLGSLPQWVRPIDPVQLLRARTSLPRLGVLGSLGRVAYGGLSLATRVLSLGRRLVPMERFDERANRVWEASAPHWPVIVRRDLPWLAWRWDACPRRDGARGVWLERRGQVVGWAMLRRQTHNGLQAGFILDLLCPPKELAALLVLAVEQLRRDGAAAVYCLLRAPGAERALRAAGFIRRDSGLAMMSHAPGLPESERRALADRDLWFVTAGDSDLARPRAGTVYA